MGRLLAWRTRRSEQLRHGGKRVGATFSRALRLESLEDRTLLSATLPSGGLTPAQIEHAYGFDLIQFAGGIKGDGSGQTIAIVDELDDPNIASDLHAFDLQFGIAEHSGFFTKVGVSPTGNVTSTLPGPSGNTGDAIETSMDVEWVHALAPGANIVLVEAANDAQIVPAMGAAANISGVSVVSLSFGAGERCAICQSRLVSGIRDDRFATSRRDVCCLQRRRA